MPKTSQPSGKGGAQASGSGKGGAQASGSGKGGAQGHARGEHIINNGVLKIYRDIVDKFVDDKATGTTDSLDKMIESNRLRKDDDKDKKDKEKVKDARLLKDLEQPTKDTKTWVEGTVIHIGPGVGYVETNDKIYGNSVRAVRDSIIAFMNSYYDEISGKPTQGQTDVWREEAEDAVRQMIDGAHFIDEQALKIWKKDLPQNRKAKLEEDFVNARAEVVSMVGRLTENDMAMVRAWVKELHNAFGKYDARKPK